jgi:SAM-dependent methyltransferase
MRGAGEGACPALARADACPLPSDVPSPVDRYDLYEHTVQSPTLAAAMLRAIHGGRPEILGEDFAGSGAVSRAWAQRPGATAVAVDRDAEALARAAAPGVRTICADVREAVDPADVIFCGNFSIGYLHTRPELMDYLRHVRSRLRPGGAFVCDTYGGESAFLTGHVDRDHPGPDGRRIRYTWEQREADALTGMVTDALHFRVFKGRDLELELRDAFIYHWRLWGVPELRDAMLEAGFARAEVYDKLPDAEDDSGEVYLTPVTGAEVDDSFIVCVAGRVDV